MRKGLGFHNRHSAGGFQPISLFAGGVNGAWYDPSDPTTLFSDRAGTTPCGTPGGGSVVPVGAMLDERAAGYSVYFDGTGDNLETPNSAAFQFGTGDFTVEGWIYVTGALSGYRIIAQCAANSSWSTGWSLVIINDRLNLWLNSGNIALSGAGTILANTWQHVAVTRSGTTVTLWINGSSVATGTSSDNLVPTRAMTIGAETSPFGYPFQGYISNLRVVKGTAVYTGAFTPSGPLSPISGTSLLTCGTSWTGNPAITKNGDARVDGLNPFTASPVGNHAIAANDTTARPELSARVNLLTYSEQFDNAYWSKGNTTVTANAAVAPDGTTTADLIYPSVTGTFRSVYRAFSGANSISISVKASGKTWISMVDLAGSSSVAWFDVANGVIGTVTAGYTAAISSQGSGWYRCTLVANSGTFAYAQFNVVDGNGTNTGTANGTDGVLLWGADGRPANIGTTIPAYQRVADQYTYDNVGFPRYLAFNGTSSAMSTPANVNLSGTDKVTVFAGVRKLSDAATGIMTELGNWNISNLQAFNLAAPSTAGAANYLAGLLGSNTAYPAFRYTTYTAPISSVIASSFDRSQATVAAQISSRINAVANAGTSIGQPVVPNENFGSYPLYIGARNNASLFFNGNIYSLLVVGSAVSAGNITATETWVNNKVGGAY